MLTACTAIRRWGLTVFILGLSSSPDQSLLCLLFHVAKNISSLVSTPWLYLSFCHRRPGSTIEMGLFLSVWYVAQRQKSVAYICALYTHIKIPLVLQKVVLLWAFYISNISITFFFVICKVFGDDYYSFRRNRKFTDCLLHEIVFLWLSGVVHAIVCLLIFDLWSSQY